MKREYENIEMEIVEFEADNVITTSDELPPFIDNNG